MRPPKTLFPSRRRSALVLVLMVFAPAAFADPCTDIVADTVAELRAGAEGWWSDEAASLVRAAAGSACIKARSGRYVPASAAAAPGPQEAGAVAGSTPESAGEGDTQEVGEDDGSWNLGGLKVRGLSGSPGAKPYQRQRKSDEEG